MNPIEKTTGPCVVLAGAGTGKTRTIIEKIKYLTNKKIYAPEKIVCITFSNEAANSIRTRLEKVLEKNKVIVRTFHGFSTDLLREHGEKINLPSKFKIINPDEAKVILHTNLRIPAGNCTKYINSIGNAKDLGIEIQEIENHLKKETEKFQNIDLEKKLKILQFEFQTLHIKKDKKNREELAEKIKEISRIIKTTKFIKAWKAYEKLKKIKNYQDYSDLNNNALKLLKNSEEIAENYDYIIVDEFQDTNKIQLELLFALAVKNNLTIVGDMNQSIYRFRGAYNKNFDEFKKHFKVEEKDIFNLDKSHRSSNKILRTAHKLISNNYENKKDLFEVENFYGREGDKIKVYELKNAKEEARKVAELIEKELENRENINEICVMFRTHQYGRILKQALDFKGIPYCAASQNSLLKQSSVKKIVDYLIILDKLKNKSKGGEQAWWDLIYQSFSSEEDLIKLGKFIKDNRECKNISVLLLNELEKIGLSEQGQVEAKMILKRIKLMLGSINKSLPELIKDIFNFAGVAHNNREIVMNLNKFYDLAINHYDIYESDLRMFINYLDILQKLSIEVEAARIEEKGVQLMTLHATKGLEYNTVIITNLAQKRFPMEKFSYNNLIPLKLYPEFKNLPEKEIDYYLQEHERKHQIYDERRLGYVAFTRARNKLILTYAQKYREKDSFASQFLQEINYKKNQDIDFQMDSGENFEIKKINFPLPQQEKKEIVFSPSALLLFDKCQKKYEYKYVYNMPEEKIVEWESILLGSFVHSILEIGVKKNFKEIKKFSECAKELHLKDEWNKVDLEEAMHLIKVFLERNKTKYNENSLTEIKLDSKIENIKFTGFADRIDFNPEGLEIVDYKTGKSNVPPKARNWQLGYYALGASKLGKVRKITLDMLKHEKPLEFEVDEDGNAKASYSNRMEFNINEIKKELIETAKKVLKAYKEGFKPCPVEKNCEFCNEWVYGL